MSEDTMIEQIHSLPDVDALSADAARQRESARIAAINDAMDAVRTSVDLSDAGVTLSDVQIAINNALAAGWGHTHPGSQSLGLRQ